MAKKAKRSAKQSAKSRAKKPAIPASLPAKRPTKKPQPAGNPAGKIARRPKPGGSLKTTARPRSAASSAKRPTKKSAASKPAARTVAKPATTPAKRGTATRAKEPPARKPHTSEENRGAHFFSVIKMWRLLHVDGGKTLFNKELLARRYFEGIEDEENPEPELHEAEAEDEFAEELDDDLDALEDDAADDGLPAGPFDAAAMSRDMITGCSPTASGGRASGGTPKPYSWIKERHKRYVQRTIDKLKNYGIGIEDTDADGNPLDEDEFKAYREAHPTAERWWRYNPHSEWADKFGQLLKYGVTGTELLAFMALRDLLEAMRGTPHERALQDHLQQMMDCLPKPLLDEAEEQSRAYRHSVGNTAKYLSKADDLERWYAATLHRQQVEIIYATPGEDRPRIRHLAALSTMFHREENSLYLLASEHTDDGWGTVRQWKCDRVLAVKSTNLPNPRLADLHADPLVQAAAGGRVERLDANRVYDYSAGAWLELGVKPQRMEIIVRVPAVGHPGMDEELLEKLQQEARRRAYNWMEWCREKPFHPRQDDRFETLASGEKQLRLVVEKCYVKEMASRLLRLQDCFEVIAPPELIVLVREYANAISRSHV